LNEKKRRSKLLGTGLFLLLSLCLLLGSCTSTTSTNTGTGASATNTSTAPTSTSTQSNATSYKNVVDYLLAHPVGASARVKVQVPSGLRSGAFTQDRYLNVPAHTQISVYTRIPSARYMTLTPTNDLLVSVPSQGKIELVRAQQGGIPRVTDFVTGLQSPQDMVFHKVGNTMYLYVGESNAVDRFVYHNGDTTAGTRQVIISGLPDGSDPQFGGNYSHPMKDFAFDSKNRLYVDIASSCNVCVADTQSNPLRDAVYVYSENGGQGKLFAQGLRNAEGIALVPGTNTLWVAVNNRDNLAYPFKDSTGQYGKVVQPYVDNHPPEEFTSVRDGGNYGWPFCNPNPDKSMVNMPFDRDVQFNADGHVDCGKMDRISQGIQAHSAPVSLTFLHNQSMSQIGALIGLHGSWDRSARTGYKLVYFPWNVSSSTPKPQIDLVTGWLDDGSQQVWGRPVDSIPDAHGNILISDDDSGTIYQLSYTH
jgi:glucose/arabinose dehydrogenase